MVYFDDFIGRDEGWNGARKPVMRWIEQLLESYSKQINGPLNVYSKGGCIVMTSSRAFQLLFTINSLTLIESSGQWIFPFGSPGAAPMTPQQARVKKKEGGRCAVLVPPPPPDKIRLSYTVSSFSPLYSPVHLEVCNLVGRVRELRAGGKMLCPLFLSI